MVDTDDHRTNEEINTSSYEPFFEIARQKIKAAEDSKKKAVAELAKDLENAGVPKDMISEVASKGLQGYVSARYVRDCLEEETKNQKKVSNDCGSSAADDDKKVQDEISKERIDVYASGQSAPPSTTQREVTEAADNLKKAMTKNNAAATAITTATTSKEGDPDQDIRKMLEDEIKRNQDLEKRIAEIEKEQTAAKTIEVVLQPDVRKSAKLYQCTRDGVATYWIVDLEKLELISVESAVDRKKRLAAGKRVV